MCGCGVRGPARVFLSAETRRTRCLGGPLPWARSLGGEVTGARVSSTEGAVLHILARACLSGLRFWLRGRPAVAGVGRLQQPGLAEGRRGRWRPTSEGVCGGRSGGICLPSLGQHPRSAIGCGPLTKQAQAALGTTARAVRPLSAPSAQFLLASVECRGCREVCPSPTPNRASSLC